jgi:hypothetical protein
MDSPPRAGRRFANEREHLCNFCRRQRNGRWIDITLSKAFPAIEPEELAVADEVAEEDREGHGWRLRRRGQPAC